MNAKSPARRALEVVVVVVSVAVLVAIVYGVVRGPKLKLERAYRDSLSDMLTITNADRRVVTIRAVKLNGEFDIWGRGPAPLQFGEAVQVDARSMSTPRRELIYLDVETDRGSKRLTLDD